MSTKEMSSGIFEITERGGKHLATINLVPGASVYGEKLIEIEGCEYRIWNPKRSKLAAMMIKKFNIPIKRDSKVLYLGAASGTTVSHVSDIVSEGIVYAVEFSPRTMRDLIGLCDMRPNIVPILADANKPQSYAHIVEEVDVIFQDVAQPNQSEIAAVNAMQFLKRNGHLLLSIKARSIDTVANPKNVFKNEIRKLEHEFDVGFEILDSRELAPFHEDHLGVMARVLRVRK
ncbi:MAG: fibrillarin-like rRNA/tRNA 2'-O-methyltransferase [Methanosarcinaceae archaeon]|nr:fibrillarin-like rRNA/tRNA 2'-O-methyltransferase [Methanosarcinaceae archaeon]MDF1532947.1 fibrillarin-like rRNA/tRNA 2'-O-methyltransferase [Methanosarcinaceae archaeon]